MSLLNLPEALTSLFIEDETDGQMVARIYSAVDAREIERSLAEYGVSYKTRIVRSRKRGIYYLITLLEDAESDVFA